MVLNFSDLEINFQRKWLFRPRQRDGMTVEDYYSQFCNWKEEMISASFPAKEDDYVEGFIENLKWDIRWRSSKYESSRIGLKIAYHNAQFEEYMIQLEAYSHTPVVVNQAAECDPIVVEAVSSNVDIAPSHNSETADEKPDEVLMVNEFSDSEEMLDFNGIHGNDSENSEVVPDLEGYKVSESAISSHPSVNSSHQKLSNPMDSGFKVLSFYCAHMASKWNTILEMRPKQSNDMSVEVYYDLFYSWKKKLDAVNYIGSEESYIDDFLYGLEVKLGMRVWGYKWKPRTLYGAFRRAEIEETMMKNDAYMVLEEMPQLNSSDIQGLENVSDEYINVVLDASGLVSDRFRSYLQVESIFQGDQSQVDAFKDSACNVIDEMVKPTPSYLQLTRQCGETVVTEYVVQILSDRVGKLPNMKTECLKVSCSLFDESSSQYSAEQIIGSEGLGLVMFCFDPGGCSFPQLDCDPFEFISEQGKFCLEINVVDMIIECIRDTDSNLVPFTGNNVVFCTADLQAALGSLGDTTVNGISNGSAEAWLEGAESIIEVVLGQNAMKEDARIMFDEMNPTFRGLLDRALSAYGDHVNIQCIRAVFVGIHAHSVRCCPFDPGGNILYRIEGNILKTYTFSFIFVIIQRERFFIYVWDTGQCALIVYILVDKDGFEGMGRKILATVMIKGMAIQLENLPTVMHFMVVLYDNKSLVNATIAIPYSTHLWGLMVNSAHLHGFSRCKNNVASIFLSEATLHCHTYYLSLCELDHEAMHMAQMLRMSMTEERNMLQVLIVWSTDSCSKHVKSYRVSLSNKGLMFSFLFYMFCCSLKTNCDRQYLEFWFGEKAPNGCTALVLVIRLSPLSCSYHSLWQCHRKRKKCRYIMDKLIVMNTWSPAQEVNEEIVDDDAYISWIQHFLKHRSTGRQPYKIVKSVASLLIDLKQHKDSSNQVFLLQLNVTLLFGIRVLLEFIFRPP